MKTKRHVLLFIIVILSIPIFLNNCCNKYKNVWPILEKNNDLTLKAIINDTIFNISDFQYYNDSTYEEYNRSICYGVVDDSLNIPGPKINCIIYNNTNHDIVISRPVNKCTIYPLGEISTRHPDFILKLQHEGKLLPNPFEEERKHDLFVVVNRQPCIILDESTIKAQDSIIFIENINPFFVYEPNNIETGKYEVELILRNPCWRDSHPPTWAGELVSNKISFRIVNDKEK